MADGVQNGIDGEQNVRKLKLVLQAPDATRIRTPLESAPTRQRRAGVLLSFDNDVDDNNGIVGEASKADIGPLMAKEKGWIEFSSGWLP